MSVSSISLTGSLSIPDADRTVHWTPPPSLMPPVQQRFGGYQLLAEIARGGMGIVYKAQHIKLNRLVALKMIRSGGPADEERRSRFYAEAEAAAKLDHPAIVPVYEVGEANGQLFFSMALVAGVSLNERVKDDGPLPAQEAARLLKRVAEAVEYAHAKGIIHRDIKPQNILLDEAGQPRLTDFGLAKQLLGPNELTANGQIMGTPSYMPPEQAIGNLDEIGPASDVYSLGATLYLLLTGRPPFQTAATLETIKQVLETEPVALRRLNPAIPRDLETICLKCLRKEPANRYATAAELGAELGRWLEHKPILARPVGLAERAWLVCKRRPALVASSLVFLALSIAGSLLAWEGQSATRAQGMVAELENADIAEVPEIVQRLSSYRRWAGPLLGRELADAKDGSREKLHTTLALLPVDETQIAYLRDQLLVVSPNQFPVVRNALLPHRNQLVEPLWSVALDEQQPVQPKFQAACALASYAPDDERWEKISNLVTQHLMTRQLSDLVAWREALRPAKAQLLTSLASVYRDAAQERQYRAFATETLADYAAGQPEVLVDLLADAEPYQYSVIFDKLDRKTAVSLAAAELAKQPAPSASEQDKENLAKRQANSAVALVRLGAAEQACPLLAHQPDPRLRTFILHWLGPLGASPQPLIERLEVESDVSVRRALVLSLGEFTETQLPSVQRQQLIAKLLTVYETDPDAGLHGAAEWLLRKWGEKEKLQAVVDKLRGGQASLASQQAADAAVKRNWYVNSQGQTLVLLEAGEFKMGSPADEPDRTPQEPYHLCKVDRRFAIAAHEVTVAQFKPFYDEHTEVLFVDRSAQVKSEDAPQLGTAWYEAASYCNWLSEKDGLTEDQWCYEPNAKKEYADGMRLKSNAADLLGYRLPTEAEWEYACRAGTTTSHYYGLSEPLLPKYAQHAYNGNSQQYLAMPVGTLKPNDFGLFDMLGNAFEYTQDAYKDFLKLKEEALAPTTDVLDTAPAEDKDKRALRGGSFLHDATAARSAMRFPIPPAYRLGVVGIRVARTVPSIPPTLSPASAAGSRN